MDDEIDEPNESIEIDFPVTFTVEGTPVSSQSTTTRTRNAWKKKVFGAARLAVPAYKWCADIDLSITIYDFPTDNPQGDVDNIVKLIQDALKGTVFTDDRLVRRVVAQRFLPSETARMDPMPELVAEALVEDPPFVYVRINVDPLGDAQ